MGRGGSRWQILGWCTSQQPIDFNRGALICTWDLLHFFDSCCNWKQRCVTSKMRFSLQRKKPKCFKYQLHFPSFKDKTLCHNQVKGSHSALHGNTMLNLAAAYFESVKKGCGSQVLYSKDCRPWSMARVGREGTVRFSLVDHTLFRSVKSLGLLNELPIIFLNF